MAWAWQFIYAVEWGSSRKRIFWRAHASRALVKLVLSEAEGASRRNKLFFRHSSHIVSEHKPTFAAARHRGWHATRTLPRTSARMVPWLALTTPRMPKK